MGWRVCPAVRVVRAESVKAGQAGHPGHTLALVEQPDDVVRHRPQVCRQCRADLSAVPGSVAEHRQVLDVPDIRLLAQEHQIEAICCPTCPTTSLGSFPAAVSALVQYVPTCRRWQCICTRGNCSQQLAPARLSHLAWHASRGREAMDEIGIWPREALRGLHDRFASYDAYLMC
jgi:hypothetical protein